MDEQKRPRSPAWRATIEMFAFIVPVVAGLWALESWAQTLDYAEQEVIGWFVGPVMVFVLFGWDAFYGYRMTMVWRDARRAGWWIAISLAVPVAISVVFDMARRVVAGNLGEVVMGMPGTTITTAVVYGSVLAGAAVGWAVAQSMLRRPREGSAVAPAAWCGMCHAYVWLDAQGCCPKGHPRESLGPPYSAHQA